jgi:hypothetical protein
MRLLCIAQGACAAVISLTTYASVAGSRYYPFLPLLRPLSSLLCAFVPLLFCNIMQPAACTFTMFGRIAMGKPPFLISNITLKQFMQYKQYSTATSTSKQHLKPLFEHGNLQVFSPVLSSIPLISSLATKRPAPCSS